MMTAETTDWRDPSIDDLLAAITALPDEDAAGRFLRDLCTIRELRDMAQRWQVVQLLALGRHYGEISRETGASTATITRIAQWFNHGTGGYREALAREAGVAALQREHAPAGAPAGASVRQRPEAPGTDRPRDPHS